jgi:hypothetical protein
MDEGDELNRELLEGRKASCSLAQHLNRMEGQRADFRVCFNHIEYCVIVAEVGPTNRSDTRADVLSE